MQIICSRYEAEFRHRLLFLAVSSSFFSVAMMKLVGNDRGSIFFKPH
ncbi:hypothetical protein EDC56_2904 [Sinobacterium caligoides]|uniref:Uncharacterized protein n=1 Tax=Sinobacterium caligoides TaxID=933926 RepID=A0A3N2DKE5_9GAMM|nr:hypothetical protein EDC56_2904 [Sinobacterium caligoides]